MTTPDTKPMQGLADFLRASAYHAPIMSDASAETLRQWAADVDAAQASSVTEPVGGGVVAALRELANVVSIHLGLGTIPGSYGPGLKGMAMSEWIRKALHASLEKSVVALSTHEATQREGGGTVSGAAEAVPVAAWLKFDGMKAMPAYEKAAYARQKDWLSKEIVSEYSIPLYRQPPAPKEVGISASEPAPVETEIALIGSVLRGYPESMARADALRATERVRRFVASRIATPPPAPQPPNANCPIKCNSMEQCSGACDFMEAAPQPAVVEALTPEQISAVYLLLVHRKRPEFGWMEVALLGAEKVLEPLHSAIHDAQFDAMDAAFRGGV